MQVTLDPCLESVLKALVASGRFRNENEAIEEGLRLLLEDEQSLIAELNAMIDEGLDDVANGRTHSPEEARESLKHHREARFAKSKA